jgi:hypothetical protein
VSSTFYLLPQGVYRAKAVNPVPARGRGFYRFALHPDVASPQSDPLRRLQTAVKRLKVFFGAPAFILSLAALFGALLWRGLRSAPPR